MDSRGPDDVEPRARAPARPDLLIALVGDNPASVLISARALRPKSILLIATARTRPKAEVLSTQVAGAPTAVVEIRGDSIDAVRSAVAAELAAVALPEYIALDITGGTKLMSLGTWEAVYAVVPDAARLLPVYLHEENRLIAARTGATIPFGEGIAPTDAALWNGFAPPAERPAEYLGMASGLSSFLGPRRAPATWLANLCGEGRSLKIEGAGVRLQPPLARLPSEVAQTGFRFDRGILLPPADDPEYFSKTKWLEIYAAATAAEAVAGAADGVHAALNLRLGAGAVVGDEQDVVLSYGARIVVVECKNFGGAAGHGPIVRDRARKVVDRFGSAARTLFIVTAWNGGTEAEQSLRTLRDEVGANVRLLGTKAEDLRREIRAALALPAETGGVEAAASRA